MAKKMVLVPASMIEQMKNQQMTDLLPMLPKRYHNNARTILLALEGKVQLDSQKRVIYPDGTGSHIIDLVRYFVTPPQLKISRPVDAYKFQELLHSAGVPESVIARKPTQWTTFNQVQSYQYRNDHMPM